MGCPSTEERLRGRNSDGTAMEPARVGPPRIQISPLLAPAARLHRDYKLNGGLDATNSTRAADNQAISGGSSQGDQGSA
ncbi:hypothetical protein NDU88_000047 [Pleurodeles waltl]|uniref:Uncharacterized protein n=1 Tax=Pleurodeles waltl TaxID=8319 RepID=A0AAV7VWE7_PLEWA|nr:hypothetical protein NDU88_000047 [Pleurodeles waltl]